jgi:hypothetical protein
MNSLWCSEVHIITFKRMRLARVRIRSHEKETTMPMLSRNHHLSKDKKLLYKTIPWILRSHARGQTIFIRKKTQHQNKGVGKKLKMLFRSWMYWFDVLVTAQLKCTCYTWKLPFLLLRNCTRLRLRQYQIISFINHIPAILEFKDCA